MTIAVLWFWLYLHVKLEKQATYYLCLTELSSALLCRALNRNWADRGREREREMCVRALNRNWADAKRERDVCACWTETEQTDGERKRCVHVLGKQDLARQYQRFSDGAFTPDANDANKLCYSREVGCLNILSLLASFMRKKNCAIRARNLRHSRVKFTTQQMRMRVMGGASARQLQSRCKMYSCFCKSTKMYIQLRVPTYNHNYFVLHFCFGFSASARNDVTARASSWLVNAARISSKVQIFQLASFASGVNAPWD